MKKTVLALSLAAALGSAQASGVVDWTQTKDSICGNRKVVSINGISTNSFGAQENLRELNAVYGNSIDQYRVEFSMVYNQTVHALADIQQSYAQIIAAYPGFTYQDWLTAVWSGILPNSITAAVAATIAGKLGELVGLKRPNADLDNDMIKMMNEIRFNYNPPNDRLLLVPHSQGNIYAVKMWDKFTTTGLPASYPYPARPPYPAQTIGMTGLASVVPAMRNGVHVSSTRDLVVKGVDIVFGVTTPNITLAYTDQDRLGHNLRAVYLAQQTGRTAIVANMDARLRALKPAGPFNLPGPGVTSSGAALTCTPTVPCVTSQGVFTQNIISYQTAGVGHAISFGGPSELQAKLSANLTACHSIMLARRAQLGSLIYQQPLMPGCSDYYAERTWANHSADSMQITYDAPVPYAYMSPPQVYYAARMKPVCKTT